MKNPLCTLSIRIREGVESNEGLVAKTIKSQITVTTQFITDSVHDAALLLRCFVAADLFGDGDVAKFSVLNEYLPDAIKMRTTHE